MANEKYEINFEKTKEVLEALVSKKENKSNCKIVVDAKDKEFYETCPHCSTEFTYKFDDVTFDNENPVDKLSSLDGGEEYIKLLTSLLVGSNNLKKFVFCPRCEQSFTPAMMTKDELPKPSFGGYSAIGGLSSGLFGGNQ